MSTIFYDDDGVIRAVSTARAGPLPGLQMAEVDGTPDIRPLQHGYSTESGVYQLPADVQFRLRNPYPERREVLAAVEDELRRTDDYGRWPEDRPPLTPHDFGDWMLYRHALRRLSDLGDPIEMIRAWPERPDGVDPVSALRARI